MWNQVYNPLNSEFLSTLAAAIPVVTLLVLLASGKVKAHLAAIIALVAAILIAVFVFTMPAGLAIRASILGVVTGFFPIGWIVLNVIFLYQLTKETGAFETLQQTIGGVTPDRRLQLLLIAFCFGAFFEGASGFGTPVAVTAAILIGLGFSPLAASGLSLIANTAPVAYGALGTPIAGLASVTGIDPRTAVSHYKVIEHLLTPYGRFALVEVRIETGRTHQIRVHISSIGHPIVGDTLYGAPQILLPNTLSRERQGTAISSRTEAKKARAHGESAATLSLPRNFLHAAQLNFTHPKGGKAVEFSAPLPEDLQSFLEKLRRSAEALA